MVTANGPSAAGAGAAPLVIPQMSASCPTNAKEEREMMQACKLKHLSRHCIHNVFHTHVHTKCICT